MTFTTAQEVIGLFATSVRARTVLDVWRRDSHPAVVEYVEGHVTRAVYRLGKPDILEVARRTEHALADVRRGVAESVPSVVDWRPDFAITHVLHYVLESLGELFTYQDFQCFTAEEPLARAMLWEPAAARIQESVTSHGCVEDAARAAMRWRIGNAYYSFLRELYVIAHLRSRGLDVRVHPLADALFRADAWFDRTVVSLYVGNTKFRHDDAGRKTSPRRILAGCDPPWHFADLRLGAQTVFGRVHLPSDEDVDALVAGLARRPSA